MTKSLIRFTNSIAGEHFSFTEGQIFASIGTIPREVAHVVEPFTGKEPANVPTIDWAAHRAYVAAREAVRPETRALVSYHEVLKRFRWIDADYARAQSFGFPTADAVKHDRHGRREPFWYEAPLDVWAAGIRELAHHIG